MRDYLSEEELEQLIRNLEKQELYAPENLKEQILKQAFCKEQPKPSALFLYRLKVIAGMAAALAMLALIPLQDKEERLPVPGWELKEEEDLVWDREREEDAVSMHVILRESSRKAQKNVNSLLDQLKENRK